MELTYKWATFTHPNKPKAWVVPRYFGQFNKSRRTDGCSATARAAPTCTSSPGPGSSDTGWSRARRHPTTPPWPTTGPSDDARRTPPINSGQPAALRSPGRPLRDLQDRLSVDDQPQSPSEWERCSPPADDHDRDRGHRATNPNAVSSTPTADTAHGPALCPPASPRGLLEPDAVKAARPVLRGAGRSNAPGLPDPTGYGLPTAAPSAGWAGAGVIDRRGSGGDAPGGS